LLRRELSGKLDAVLRATTWVVAFLTVVVTGILKADPNDYVQWPFVHEKIISVQKSAWLVLPIFLIIAGIAGVLLQRIGRPKIWNAVHYLLDEYRQQIFGTDPAKSKDPDYYHRVTLFKHVWLRPTLRGRPWGGWMIPVERSGQRTKSGIARFRASEHEPDRAQGVAGQTWARSRPVSVYGLPDINVPAPLPEECERYATEGLVPQHWVYRRKRNRMKGASNGRAFFGIPIEVEGRTWGAVVIDSRSPDEIAIEPLLDKPGYSFKLLGGTLSKLLAKR
jgi:hypothetical protein